MSFPSLKYYVHRRCEDEDGNVTIHEHPLAAFMLITDATDFMRNLADDPLNKSFNFVLKGRQEEEQ